jgi:hypothetical protein
MDSNIGGAFIGILLIGLVLNENYNQSQCRLEAMKVSMPADDITKVCGK